MTDLDPRGLDQRGLFFVGSFDSPVAPVIPHSQPFMWTSEYYACKYSAIAGARLDRHETYDADGAPRCSPGARVSGK